VSLILRLLAAALVAQLAVMTPPMGGAAAHGHAIDPAALICSGQADTPEVRAALADLSQAVAHGRAHGSPDPAPHDHDEHCPACALSKAMGLPEAATLTALTALSFPHAMPRADRASPRQTAGPPVGLRAPPLTV